MGKVPGKSTLRGTIVKEHGTKAFSMGRFQSCSLSTGSHADRSWRGEVLVLEEFCHIFGVHGVIGTARLYSSTVPCVSTVCVLAQFCQLLPDVKLTAVNGFQCP